MKMNQWLLAASLVLASITANATRLHILSENRAPIAGAEVLIGTAANAEFSGNVLTTDQNGYVDVPADWKTALPVTITAAQYIKTTFVSVEPNDAELQLHAEDPAQMVTVAGETTDFGPLVKDGQVDFGLVFPAMAKRRLMQFNVAELISSEYDTIKVITEQVQLPSNVTLPTQKESYILPITLSKPAYRMQVRPIEDHRMSVIHGQFPLKKVVDSMRSGKSFLEIVNDFKFFGGGQVDVAATATDVGGINIPVNQVKFDGKVSFTAPAFAADQIMFAVAVVEQNGLFSPSDFKRVETGEVRDLLVPNNANQKYIVSLATPKPVVVNIGKSLGDELRLHRPTTPAQYMALFQRVFRQWMEARRARTELAPTSTGISLAITPAGTAGAPEQVEIAAQPVVQGTRLALTPPAPNAAVNAVATYVTLAQVERKVVGRMKSEKRTRVMEFFANGWVNGIDLPDLTTVLQAGKTYRWEVMYLGRDAQLTPSPTDYFLDEITHVSRNSVDL